MRHTDCQSNIGFAMIRNNLVSVFPVTAKFFFTCHELHPALSIILDDESPRAPRCLVLPLGISPSCLPPSLLRVFGGPGPEYQRSGGDR